MADQDFNAAITVTNEGSSAIEQYTASLAAAAEAEAAVSEGAVALSEATTASDAAIAEQVATLQGQVASLTESNAALQEQVAALSENTTATRENAVSKQELAVATKELTEGNIQGTASLAGFGAEALVGVAVVARLAETFNDLSKAGADAEVAIARLGATEQAAFGSSEKYGDGLKVAEAQAVQFGITNTEVENSLARIIPILPNMAEDYQVLTAAENIAAVTGKDLTTVEVALARAIETGTVTQLTRMGIVLTDSTGHVLKHADATQILTAVQERYGTAAQQVADTGAGSAARLDAAQKNLDETAGKFFTDSTKGWNDYRAQMDTVVADQVAQGNAFAGALTVANKALLGIPEAGATAVGSLFGLGDQLKTQDQMLAIFSEHAKEAGGVSLGTLATGAEKASEAVGGMKGPLDEADSAALATGKAFDTLNTAVDQSAEDAKAATAAYTLATSDGLQAAVVQVQEKMASITKELDITEQAMDAAIQSGDAHKQGLLQELEKELIASQADMQSELDILNSLIGPAGAAGAAAGNNWAANYQAAIAQGMANAMAETRPEGGVTMGPSKTANDWNLQNDPNGPEVAANRAAIRKAADAAAIAGGYKDAPKGKSGSGQTPADLEAQAQELQLTKDNTEASNAYTQASKAKTEADKEFDNALQKINDSLTANTEAEQNDANLNAARNVAKQTQVLAASQAGADAAAANDLAVAIHQVNDQLAELKREADQAMAPLKAQLDADTQAMNDLDHATAAMDHTFTDALNAIQEKQYEQAQQAAADMAPLQATLDQANAAYSAAQQKVTDLSNAEANELFPVEQKLNELAQEKANLQRADTLGNEAQSVANLTARLNDAVKGSAEYNALLKAQKDAQQNLGIDEQIDQETKKKDAIQNSYAVRIQAAKLEEEAAAVQQKAAQAQYDAQKKIEDQKAADLAKEAQNIQHQQTLYDEQAADKKYAQQQAIDADNAAIKAQQALDDQRAASDKAYLAQLQNEQQEQAFTASQDQYNWGLAVKAANDAVTALEAPYNTEKTRLDNLAQGVRDQKTAYDESVQPILDDLSKIKDSTQAALDVFKGNQDAAKEADAWAKAVKAGGEGLAAMHDQGPNVAGDIAAIKTASTDATTALQGFAAGFSDPSSGLVAKVGPALTGLRQTVNKYMGLPQDPGFDATQSIGWFLDHKNVQGFHGRVIESFDLGWGVDGLRGMADNRTDQLTNDIIGRFDSFATTLYDEGVKDATSYADGFFNTLNKRFGVGAPTP